MTAIKAFIEAQAQKPEEEQSTLGKSEEFHFGKLSSQIIIILNYIIMLLLIITLCAAQFRYEGCRENANVVLQVPIPQQVVQCQASNYLTRT